ncbi:MAG: hypothetical protein ACHWZW_07885 [Spirulina sp.]
MERLKLRGYKQALCEHFGVANGRELRENKVWLEFAEENELPDLQGFDAWKQAYEVVFDVYPTDENEAKAPELGDVVNQGLRSFQSFTQSVWSSKPVTEVVGNLQVGATDIGDVVEDVISDRVTDLQDLSDNALKTMFSVFQGQQSADVAKATSVSDKNQASISTEIEPAEEEEAALTVMRHEGWGIKTYQPEEGESASFTELQDSSGNTVGALLQYSPEQSQQLIDHFHGLSLHSPNAWHKGKLNSAVVDQLGATSAVVASGMNAGQLFRVIGPPDAVAGLANGTHKLVQSGGSLGTVRDLATGRFSHQLRFAQTSVMPILAPIVAYQVLHAIVGTQQINQINQRLAHMEQILEELNVRQEAAILGEIYYAVNVLDDIESERMHTGIFTPDASNRLALVEKNILAILERNRLLVERFRDKTKNARLQRGRQGARSAAELLKSSGKQAVHDMQCLIGLIAADLKLEQMLLLQAMQNNPNDVGRRQERIHSKMKRHEQVITNLPSVTELERHANACLKAMQWWDRLVDFGQTSQEVKETQTYGLEDVNPGLSIFRPSLNGYIFWKSEEGIQVFSMPGDDLQLQPTELASEDDLGVRQVTVKEQVVTGKTYQLQLPEASESLRIAISEEVEPGIWLGQQLDQEIKQPVMIYAHDYL